MPTAHIAIALGFATVAILLVFVLVALRRLGEGRQLREEFRLNRDEAANQAQALRAEVSAIQRTHFEQLLTRQSEVRDLLDQKIATLQKSNEEKLEQMRRTVNEQLQSTLEKRLGESFKQVSERLEAVHKGLGEMQNLASGVGDLKRVLTNVKERGTWGEYQLEAILSEILAPTQYAKNVSPRGDNKTIVEFAIRLPGKDNNTETPVWLPIDSKFPKEAYERLVDAAATADVEGVAAATRDLKNAVLKMARDIHEKYIHPPHTTDFAILFLPTEGLYAEVLRLPGLQNQIQTNHRVVVAGPTTLSALLTSFRVGFQTLAIEKSASETRILLGAVKTQFGKFGDMLDRLRKQVGTVAKTIDESTRKTQTIRRKLASVTELPAPQATALLGFDTTEDDTTANDDNEDNEETTETTDN